MTDGTAEDQSEKRSSDISSRFEAGERTDPADDASQEPVDNQEESREQGQGEGQEQGQGEGQDQDRADDRTEDDRTDEDDGTIRDLQGRTFFVGEDILVTIDARFKQYDAQYHLEHGEELKKTEQFYRAMFQNVDWDGVEADLGLDEDDTTGD